MNIGTLGLLYCYEPGVEQFKNKPERTFQAVINTDVLEHIPEEFVYDIIKDTLYTYAENFVYFSIATKSAKAIPSKRTKLLYPSSSRVGRDY